MDLSMLREPFPSADIEWRIGRAGTNDKGVWATCLAYVTNRAIMERLDDVCGPGNWRNEYKEAPSGGVLCGLSIRVGDEWVTKWDGADNTEIDAVKGGLSGSMKRAGVQWGIGRYLYHLDEGWAIVSSGGANYGKTKDNKPFRWDPPGLPGWALPGGSGKPGEPNPPKTAAESAKKGVAATEKQIAEITKLSETEAITEKQRDKLRVRLIHGLTMTEAIEAIDWLKSTIEESEAEAA